MSEFEIALLFPLCVASFAAFLFALSPRLYCEGVERWVISSVLRSKIRTERTERAKDFFVGGDENNGVVDRLRSWRIDTMGKQKRPVLEGEDDGEEAIHGKY